MSYPLDTKSLPDYRSLGWPRCAHCNDLVDFVESYYDINRDSTRYRVWCHGEWQETEMTSFEFANNTGIQFATAFVRERIL